MYQQRHEKIQHIWFTAGELAEVLTTLFIEQRNMNGLGKRVIRKIDYVFSRIPTLLRVHRMEWRFPYSRKRQNCWKSVWRKYALRVFITLIQKLVSFIRKFCRRHFGKFGITMFYNCIKLCFQRLSSTKFLYYFNSFWFFNYLYVWKNYDDNRKCHWVFLCAW